MFDATLHLALISMSIAGLKILERAAFKSVIQFLISFVSIDTASILTHARLLVCEIIKSMWISLRNSLPPGLLFQLPRTYLAITSELLFKLISLYPAAMKQWLNEAFKSETPVMPSHISESACTDFIRTLLSTRQLRRFKEVVKLFVVKYRGLDSSEFGSVV